MLIRLHAWLPGFTKSRKFPGVLGAAVIILLIGLGDTGATVLSDSGSRNPASSDPGHPGAYGPPRDAGSEREHFDSRTRYPGLLSPRHGAAPEFRDRSGSGGDRFETPGRSFRTGDFIAVEEINLSPDPVSLFDQLYDHGPESEQWSISESYGTLSLRDALRSLLYVDQETGGGKPGITISSESRRTAPAEGARGRPASGSVLDTRLAPEMLDVLFAVLSPSLEPDGKISFSIAGLGNFMMVLSEEVGALRLVDLDNGNALTLKSGRQDVSGTTGPDMGLMSSGPPQRTSTRITIHEFLLTVRKFLFSIVRDNRFIGIFAVFALIWVVWRVYRHSS